MTTDHFERLVQRLANWRNADHHDNIVLTRDSICTLLDGIHELRPVDAVSQRVVSVPTSAAYDEALTSDAKILANGNKPYVPSPPEPTVMQKGGMPRLSQFFKSFRAQRELPMTVLEMREAVIARVMATGRPCYPRSDVAGTRMCSRCESGPCPGPIEKYVA